MDHRYYNAYITDSKNGETFNYYWLHLYEPDLTKQLDYK